MTKKSIKKLVDGSKSSLSESFDKFSKNIGKDLAGIKKKTLKSI